MGRQHTLTCVSASPRKPPAAPRPGVSATNPTPAGLGRRFIAVLIDWLLCQAIAVGLLGVQVTHGGVDAFVPLGIFAVENLVLVGTVGSTIGHRLLGLRVLQARPGLYPVQVLVRTMLLCLFLPAIFTSSDGRGFHDVLAGTRIVRI